MDSTPLVREEFEVGARFIAEFHKRFPVQSAFWLRGSDEGIWRLYVASDQITDENRGLAIKEVVRIRGEMRDPWLDGIQVRVIGTDHRLAQAAYEAQGRYPGRPSMGLRDQIFGGMGVEFVYLYPAPKPVPASERPVAKPRAGARKRGKKAAEQP